MNITNRAEKVDKKWGHLSSFRCFLPELCSLNYPKIELFSATLC